MTSENSTIGISARKRAVGFVAVVLLVIGGCWLAFYFSPIGRQFRHYGPAEEIVNEFVIPFRSDLLASDTSVETLLDLPRYRELKDRVVSPDSANGEVARFHMNAMFEIGVKADGSILWHAD